MLLFRTQVRQSVPFSPKQTTSTSTPSEAEPRTKEKMEGKKERVALDALQSFSLRPHVLRRGLAIHSCVLKTSACVVCLSIGLSRPLSLGQRQTREKKRGSSCYQRSESAVLGRTVLACFSLRYEPWLGGQHDVAAWMWQGQREREMLVPRCCCRKR